MLAYVTIIPMVDEGHFPIAKQARGEAFVVRLDRTDSPTARRRRTVRRLREISRSAGGSAPDA